MNRLTMAAHAMATRFEWVLTGRSEAELRGAGEEAFAELARIEALLSIYKPGSEIAQINARAASEPVRVSPEVFNLLLEARELSRLTGGTFDPTVAPLVRAWGFMKGNGSLPTAEEIAAARELVGFEQLELDPACSTIRFRRAGMMLDLGAIGKGYALDRAAEILRDAGVVNALLHGGTSSILALGNDPDGEGWKVAIEHPQPVQDQNDVLAVVPLKDQSLSVSAVSGKYFEREGKKFGHVIDPRTGRPAENVLLGAIVTETAIRSDAASTAVLLGRDADLDRLAFHWPDIGYLQARTAPESLVIRARGITVHKSLDIRSEPSV